MVFLSIQQASSSKNDVYQYVVNAASTSGQYMGLMAMGPDGKLAPVRNDRSAIPHQPPSAAVSLFYTIGKFFAVLLFLLTLAFPVQT